MRLTDQIFYRKLYFSIPMKEAPSLREVYAVLIKGEKNILFDCGVSYHYPDIVCLAAEAGLTLADIDALVFSHCHADHTGGAAKLKAENPRMEIWASPLCRPMVEDIDLQFKLRPVAAFYTTMGGPVKVDRELKDGEIIDVGFPVEVLYTPGHSAGSISLYLPEQKTLLTGDAIPYVRDLPIYDDLAAEKASLEKLRARSADVIVSAFCGPWDQKKQGDVFAVTDDYLALVQSAVDTFLREHPDEPIEAMGRYVIGELGLDALPIPIFLTSLKEHIKVSKERN